MNDINSFCSSFGVFSIVKILKNILGLVQIILPILFGVSLVLIFTKLVMNPDEKKYLKQLRNSFLALLFAFFVPVIVNAFMNMVDESFSISKCWNYVESISLSNEVTYQDIYEKDRKNIGIDPKDFEKGEERKNLGEDTSKNNGGDIINGNTYNSVTNIASYRLEDMHRAVVIAKYADTNTAQSFAVSDKYFIVHSIRHGNNKTLIRMYNKSNGSLVKTISTNFYHANGACYNNNTGVVTVARLEGNKMTKYSLNNSLNGNYNPSNFNLSRGVGSIAYDKVTNNYYFAGGSHFYIADSNMNIKKKYNKIRVGINQDIGGYGGIVFIVEYFSGKGHSAVDMYRAKDGKYIGSVDLKTSLELESVDYDGKTMSFLFNKSGYPDYIYTKNIDLK